MCIRDRVITVPGAAFGQNGKNHVRMSYANSYENIAKAMDILEKGEMCIRDRC